MSDYIKAQSLNTKGGRLTGQDIRAYISENFQVDYHPNAIYKLLHGLGFSWITKRVAQGTLNNPKKLKTSLKKLQIEMINRIPGHMALNKVNFWFQDEARFGQQNTTTRLWAEREHDQERSNNNNLSMPTYLVRFVLAKVLEKQW